jgi:hypothetical protein
MKRPVRMLVYVALAVSLAAARAAPAVAAAIQPPPAAGEKVPLGCWGNTLLWRLPNYEWPTDSGIWWVDGYYGNSTNAYYTGGVTITDPYLTVEYITTGGVHIAYETFKVPGIVLPSNPSGDYFRPVHHRQTVPPGADPAQTRWAVDTPTEPGFPNYQFAYAAPGATYQGLGDVVLGTTDTTTLEDGRTQVTVTVHNDGTEIVGPLILSAWENYGTALPSPNYLLDVLEFTPNDSAKAARLAPGESTTFVAKGCNATPASPPGLLRAVVGQRVEAYPVPNTAVFRFYNVRTGAHFYTASTAERDYVKATWPTIFRDEGTSYAIHSAASGNNTPLYRFYNVRTGAHFYTASTAERDYVKATWPTIFNDEGIAYYVSTTPAGATPVYRFYNRRTGAHFYTTSDAERQYVNATWPTIFRDEGAVYYLAP